MTKHIRIENADTAPYKVAVEVWDKSFPEGSGPDTLVKVIRLDHPTAITPEMECYITSTRYLVVKEVE